MVCMHALNMFDTAFSNSLIIHQVQTMKILTVTVFGYLIFISIDFYNFSSPFSRQDHD